MRKVSLILLALFAAGCGKKPKSASNLSSDFRALSSYSAQADLFIDHVKAGKASNNYARAHAHYINQETKEALKQMEEATTEPQLEALLRECRQQYGSLSEQLGRLELSIENPSGLDDIKENIKRIRAAAENPKAVR